MSGYLTFHGETLVGSLDRKHMAAPQSRERLFLFVDLGVFGFPCYQLVRAFYPLHTPPPQQVWRTGIG